MNLYNKRMLSKALECLKSLHFKTENIMVTGSIALKLQGLLEDRPSHDVDFIVKMDDQTWRCLKLIEAIYTDDAEKEKSSSRKNKSTVFLNYDGVKINIWRYDDLTDWSDIKDSKTGVYVATVDHILKVKKLYGRDKDFKDINEIVKSLL